jgi:hypothetical protein
LKRLAQVAALALCVLIAIPIDVGRASKSERGSSEQSGNEKRNRPARPFRQYVHLCHPNCRLKRNNPALPTTSNKALGSSTVANPMRPVSCRCQSKKSPPSVRPFWSKSPPSPLPKEASQLFRSPPSTSPSRSASDWAINSKTSGSTPSSSVRNASENDEN